MAVFVITDKTTVGELKAQFLQEFGGGLRVYDSSKRAEDDVLLVAIGAKTGHIECRANRTVGGFNEAFLTELNLKVKVWTVDYYVEVLEGITLSKVRELPKAARKADLEQFVGYQRSEGEKPFEVPEVFKERVVIVIDLSNEMSEDVVKESIKLYNKANEENDDDTLEALAEKCPGVTGAFGAVVAIDVSDEDAYSVACVGDMDASTDFCLSEVEYQRNRNYDGELSPFAFLFSTKVEVYNAPGRWVWEFENEILYILDEAYGTQRYYNGDRDEWCGDDTTLFVRHESNEYYSAYHVVSEEFEYGSDYTPSEVQQIIATMPKCSK